MPLDVMTIYMYYYVGKFKDRAFHIVASLQPEGPDNRKP